MPELIARKQIRLKNYDYSENGYYFITICSQNRENIFGEIVVGADGCRPDNNIQIKLNKFGLIVDEKLKNTENIRNEIKLDQCIIMPNHLHCIITLNRAASQPPLLAKKYGKKWIKLA